MTEEEAKRFYKKYDGSGFHMFREEPDLYEELKRLDIPAEIRRKWDGELLDEIFGAMWEDPGTVWIKHGRIIDILERNADTAYIERFLDEMEKMPALDKRSKILITENMAGRSSALKGGCMVVCRSSGYAERMDGIMDRIMDFECGEEDISEDMGWTDMPSRYARAAAAYREAFRKWNGRGRL